MGKILGKKRLISLLCTPSSILLFLFSIALAHALEPYQVLVLANQNSAPGVELANEYISKRSIPKGNLLVIRTSDRESCSRREYDEEVAEPVRRFLREKNLTGRIRCIATIYGIPLKVLPPEPNSAERSKLNQLKATEKQLLDRKASLQQDETEAIKAVTKELRALRKEMAVVRKTDQGAALDSELALVLQENYTLSGWMPNPFFIGFKNKTLSLNREDTLMVSRLDGPSIEAVRRMIDENIAAERNGLEGTAYFDARWPKPSEEKRKTPLKAYALYDYSIHLAAEHIVKSNRLPVLIDDQSTLFQPGQCPKAAIYCGWYSKANYIDAFEWVPGSVGYHIASYECTTLKKKESQVWCKRMIEEGIVATVGPVAEPYVQAFPVPEIFFGLLVHGRLSLAECYILSTPFLSWQMVLLGDPLYRPWKNGR